MTKTTAQALFNANFVGPVKPLAAYLVKQNSRKRYSFGNVWLNSVLAGVVFDQAKLVAHAVELGLGKAYDLKRLKAETLLAKVQTKLAA